MEITLEKIELVKDRTGVTYKEAKEALEAAEGNVVDAIIALEEEVNENGGAGIGARGENLKAKIKEIIDKGNVSRVIVSSAISFSLTGSFPVVGMENAEAA